MGSFTQSAFADLPPSSENEQFVLTKEYEADRYDKKVNLAIEEYKDRNGEIWVLPVVRQTELELIMDASLTHSNSSIHGHEGFIHAAQRILFGHSSSDLHNRLASIQTVSGTGACAIGVRLLRDSLKPNTIWMPDLACTNHTGHHAVWNLVEGVHRRTYPHSLCDRSGTEFERLMAILDTDSHKNDIVLLDLRADAGLNLMPEQWEELGELCQKKGVFPFFEAADQGFASGDPETDAFAIRCFIRLGLEFCVAQSFSRNFGLYGEPVGCLHAILASPEHRELVLDRLCYYQSGLTSTPPMYGAVIVSTILNSEELYRAWRADLSAMTNRVKKLRIGLYNELTKRGTLGNWAYLLTQKGMFAYTRLTKQHAELLRSEFHIYIMSTGRISLPGLNAQNIEWVADAINNVVTRFPMEDKEEKEEDKVG